MKFKFYTVKQGKEEYIQIKAKTKAEALDMMKAKYPENKIRRTIIDEDVRRLHISSKSIKQLALIPLTLLISAGLFMFFSSGTHLPLDNEKALNTDSSLATEEKMITGKIDTITLENESLTLVPTEGGAGKFKVSLNHNPPTLSVGDVITVKGKTFGANTILSADVMEVASPVNGGETKRVDGDKEKVIQEVAAAEEVKDDEEAAKKVSIAENNEESEVISSQSASLSNEQVRDIIFLGEAGKLTPLLENGMDPHRGCDDSNRDCVIYAAMFGTTKMLELLLAYGGNPNVTQEPLSPLFGAITAKNLQSVELLLAYGADPNLKFKSDPLTPYALAYHHGYDEIAEAILKAGGTFTGAPGSTVDLNGE